MTANQSMPPTPRPMFIMARFELMSTRLRDKCDACSDCRLNENAFKGCAKKITEYPSANKSARQCIHWQVSYSRTYSLRELRCPRWRYGWVEEEPLGRPLPDAGLMQAWTSNINGLACIRRMEADGSPFQLLFCRLPISSQRCHVSNFTLFYLAFLQLWVHLKQVILRELKKDNS
jgi:hypothetical protein